MANTYLKASFLKFDRHDAQKVKEGITKNTALGFQQFLTTYKAEKLKFLEDFLVQRDTQFSATFEKYVEADIKYWWGQNLMRYREQHPASAIFPVTLSLSDAYFEFMEDLDLNNEEALNNVHYIKYLEAYSKWRQDRITKGKLKFKNVPKAKRRLVRVEMVETFGHVLIDQLGVRKEAYDPLSTFAHLERGSEILYLQDVTNDRFSYPYKGRRYLDKFLKIELPDGRIGWVFKGGLNLKQKIVYTNKWVEVPNSKPDYMQNFKYANFKGKVMHYAVARDLYKGIQNGKIDNKALKEYLDYSKENEFKEILKIAYQKFETNNRLPSKLLVPKNNTTKDKLINNKILRNITQKTVKNLIAKHKITKKKDSIALVNKGTKITVIGTPDFEKFTKNTTIKGNISPSAIGNVHLTINKNPILREATGLIMPKNNRKDFQFDLPLNAETAATLKVGNSTVDLHIEPGYDLTINISENNNFSGISFAGKGSMINNYLLAQAKKFQQEKTELEQQIRYAGPGAFKDYMTKQKNKKLQFLRKYLQIHQLSTEDYIYAKANILYWYAFNLTNYPFEHPLHNNQPTPMPVPIDYYDFIDEIPVNNKKALSSKFYTYYLKDALSYLSTKKENNLLTKEALAEKYLKEEPLYFYKALQITNQINRNNKRTAFKNTIQFINECPNELYSEFVKLAYHQNLGLVEGMMAPSFELADNNGNLVSLEDYKGKVIFLDFWATWCGPCKRLEPYHKQLQNQFKGDNIAFLYVSMDHNAINWKNYLAKGTFPGQHLLANKEMKNNYKVDTLPYSLIIDTNGKIVWIHTGGFSVQKTAQRILELLQ